MQKQPEPIKKRRKAKIKIKPSLIVTYASVFIIIVAIIFVGYSQPVSNAPVANVNVNPTNTVAKTSVDEVVATGVAAIVAQSANLPIASNVANLAVSTQTQIQIDQSNSTGSAKPQIITGSNRSIITYIVKDGDTIDAVAANFKISVQTIKWANNLVGDNLTVGSGLQILPIDGVAYTVKEGDTVDSIAEKYQVDKTRLVLYNDLDVSGLTTGSVIILPDATLPTAERPGYVAPVTVTYNGAGYGGTTFNIGYGTPGYPGNTYSYGNCTRYAYDRRIELGLRVSANWGNANTWAWNAAVDGLLVDNTPSVGAIIQNGGGAGHVAIVESIKANGDLSISEMNAYVFGGGWNIVSGRIVPAGNVGQYNYIH